MKQFCGNASIVINFNFNVDAEDIEEAKDLILFSEEMIFNLLNKNTGENIDLEVQEWNIPEVVGRGNILESGLVSFDICED